MDGTASQPENSFRLGQRYCEIGMCSGPAFLSRFGDYSGLFPSHYMPWEVLAGADGAVVQRGWGHHVGEGCLEPSFLHISASCSKLCKADHTISQTSLQPYHYSSIAAGSQGVLLECTTEQFPPSTIVLRQCTIKKGQKKVLKP